MTNKQIREQLDIFLEKDNSKLELPMTPLTDLAEILDEKGFTVTHEGSHNLAHGGNTWDTNGWQVDFWWGFSHKNGNKYTLSGSLWDGGFKITKDEGLK